MSQQSLKLNHLKLSLHSISVIPPLQPIPSSTIRILQQSFKNSLVQKYILKEISNSVSSQISVFVRLKYWTLVHLLISANTTPETQNATEFIIDHIFEKFHSESSMANLLELDRYFVSQIEQPYLSLLKKLVVWKQFQLSSLQTDAISLGFSQLNKIKEILQLKRIFHNYSCYYPQHLYVFNIFESCLINIKKLWISVCIKIKNITLSSLKTRHIQAKQFMLIQESQLVQDLLFQFVYGQKLSAKLPKSLLFKQINLIKPEISKLYQEINNKQAIQAIVNKIKQKQKRKTNQNSLDDYQETKQSDQNEERLNTQQKIQIINSIDEIQNLLSFNI